MHETFFPVFGQRWLWVAALTAAAVAGVMDLTLGRFARTMRRHRRIILASLAAPLLCLLVVAFLVLVVVSQPTNEWTGLALAAVLLYGLTAATVAFASGLATVLLSEWFRSGRDQGA